MGTKRQKSFLSLKEWRKTQDISQKQLAAEITRLTGKHFRQSHVSGWEQGSMPDFLAGEAITALTLGKVRARSFMKLEKETDDGESK